MCPPSMNKQPIGGDSMSDLVLFFDSDRKVLCQNHKLTTADLAQLCDGRNWESFRQAATVKAATKEVERSAVDAVVENESANKQATSDVESSATKATSAPKASYKPVGRRRHEERQQEEQRKELRESGRNHVREPSADEDSQRAKDPQDKENNDSWFEFSFDDKVKEPSLPPSPDLTPAATPEQVVKNPEEGVNHRRSSSADQPPVTSPDKGIKNRRSSSSSSSRRRNSEGDSGREKKSSSRQHRRHSEEEKVSEENRPPTRPKSTSRRGSMDSNLGPTRPKPTSRRGSMDSNLGSVPSTSTGTSSSRVTVRKLSEPMHRCATTNQNVSGIMRRARYSSNNLAGMASSNNLAGMASSNNLAGMAGNSKYMSCNNLAGMAGSGAQMTGPLFTQRGASLAATDVQVGVPEEPEEQNATKPAGFIPFINPGKTTTRFNPLTSERVAPMKSTSLDDLNSLVLAGSKMMMSEDPSLQEMGNDEWVASGVEFSKSMEVYLFKT